MNLEHINLVVKNFDQTMAFYQAAFPHWYIRDSGEQVWHGTPRKWMHFGDDYQYLALNDNGSGENRDLETNLLGLSHFGFTTNNLDAVIRRLLEAGFNIHKDGNPNEHRRNIYFLDPNDFEVEFTQYLSDLPGEMNS